MLNKIRENLKVNNNLANEFKGNLFELTALFNEFYPNIPLNDLEERLKTLKFTTVSKFASSESVYYNPNKNQLVFNEALLAKEEDVRYLMMQCLLDVISKKNTPDNESLKGFRQGYKALIANNLVGNESEVNKGYDNMITVNLLGHLISLEALDQLFFNYDIEPISKQLRDNNITNKEFADLLDKMSYNATTQGDKLDTQYAIAKMFVQKNSVQTQIDAFLLNSDSDVAKTLLAAYVPKENELEQSVRTR